METKELRSLTTEKPTMEKRDDDEQLRIVGYAVKWGQRSHPMWGFQEIFQKGAFARALENPDVYAAWNHNASEILGRTPNTLVLEEDEVGLRYEILAPTWAARYVETIERGDVRGSSFIFRPVLQEWDESDPDMAIRTIVEAELYEVSPVTNPAYPQSTAGVRSADSNPYEEYKRSIAPEPDTRAAMELRHKQRERELKLIERG